MSTSRKAFVAGIAALALVGTCGLALANGPARHTMTVQLPDGGTAQIEYSGNVAPKVSFDTTPFEAGFFAPASPFAAMERISAAMDRQMGLLLRQADVMPRWQPNAMFDADLRNAPAGMTQYSMVATLGGHGVCTRSVEITRSGPHARPKIVSHSSGDCGAAGATFHAPAAPAPGLTSAALHGRAPSALPQLREAAYRSSF